MIRDDVAQLVLKAVTNAQEQGDLPPMTVDNAAVERPQNPEHGDYASSLPLRLARAAHMSPMRIAQAIEKNLPKSDSIASVEIAPPGFLNFRLGERWLAGQVEGVRAAGGCFGQVNVGQGKRVQVEFVSANPVGPLHVAAGRAGALGDVLARVLAAAGYQAEREYLVNDAGGRIEMFNQSIFARYAQALGHDAEVPAEGYHGEYMVEMGKLIAEREGKRFLEMERAKAAFEIGQLASKLFVQGARADLERMGVHYDCWFSEQSLYDSDEVSRVISYLRERGYVAEKEGATWFVSSDLGEDMENVLIRSNGVPTYFASDIAYHYDKFIRRGLDRVIDIWGADHQGHVPRMHAAAAALGVDPERLVIIIHQMITLKRGDQIVKLSKRTGDIITLQEVLDEVGADACRFFFLSRSTDAQMDFDLDLAKEQSAKNPVYYVQYAHARIASILRLAAERGISYADGDLSLLADPAELTLIRHMLELPELVEGIAKSLEPHTLPHYAQELAEVFHQFYKVCRVVDEENPELSKARLRLVEAAKIVLANTLGLMGVSAPERM